MNNQVDISYFCNLIYQIFKVPIHFLSTNKNILYKFSSNDICNPFDSSIEESLNELYQKNDLYNFPLVKTNKYLEHYVLIHITDHTYEDGTLIIGPSMYPQVSEDMVIKLMEEFNSSASIPDGISYYNSIPVMNKITLIQIGILLYSLISKEKLDVNTVWKRNKSLEQRSYPAINPDLYISSQRQNSSKYYDITLERQFFTAIKEGNKQKLIQHAYEFPQENAATLSNTSQLRNQKNNGIIAITLATRYAIDGNLPSEIAFSLSELYIQALEQLDNMYSINRVIEDALCTFADHVKEYNSKKYSNMITLCLDYINRNIYREVSLNDLAKLLNITPTYLSRLFKKEVEISFSEYIQRERIEEAKKLLLLTSYPLSDICAWLNFNDQSYFTRVFKKFTSMTPKQYREQHTVI